MITKVMRMYISAHYMKRARMRPRAEQQATGIESILACAVTLIVVA